MEVIAKGLPSVQYGGAEGTRTPGLLRAREALGRYLNFLAVKNLSVSYIEGNRRFLTDFVNTYPVLSPNIAIEYLSRYSHITQNSRARYASYLKCFLRYLGDELDINVKRPFLLPKRVYENDINKLKETIKNHRTHKSSTQRDLILIETAINTGLRRAELANLAVGHINFEARRLLVVGGKGNKDRVIPLTPNLALSLCSLCEGLDADERVFRLTSRSLGLKIGDWAKKAGVPIHTHSFRHYFATTLVEKGANIRVVQELLGHSSLNTTQIYLSVTANHLEEAIGLLDE